jgi:tRNA threonylcarbamoyladenosine biosynthesis protein TsaE
MAEKIRLKTRSPEETRRFGSALGASLEPGAFVGLVGPLGSGKTVVVQGAARALGHDGYVSSPSFVIVNEYVGRVPILHVDLYRIADARELDDIGYREIFFSDSVALVEWSDRVPDLVPPDRLHVQITIEGRDVRVIEVSAAGEAANRVLCRLRENLAGRGLECLC